MVRSRHTVKKYLSDGKAHAAIISKLFTKLDHVKKSLFEIELSKAQIEHKERIIFRGLIPQYAKVSILKLYHKFFYQFL